MKTTSWSVMAGAALALVGCVDRDFDTPWLLNHARILAIQAEPPQPATGESTTLRALVYQPPARGDAGAREVVTKYRWRWCPTTTMMPNDPSQCPIDQDTADKLFAGIPGVPRLDLGESETATFTNPFPASMLKSLCLGDTSVLPALAAVSGANGSDSSGGMGFTCINIAGFPITIQLEVTVEVAGVPDPKRLPAIFKVYLPANDELPRNQNPVVGAINLSEAGAKYPIDEAGTWSAVRGGTAPLLLDLSLSNSEPLPDWQQAGFLKKDPYVHASEQLNVYWFTESGSFDGEHGDRTTVFYGGDPNDPVSPFSSLLDNKLKPDKADKYEWATARLYAVVLDNRNGVTWTTGVLRMVNQPEPRDGGPFDAPPDTEPPADAAADSEEEAGVADAMVEALP